MGDLRKIKSINDFQYSLIDLLQNDFPIEPRPFKKIAEILDTSENRIIGQTSKIQEYGSLKGITAVFNSRNIGFKSTLIGAKISRYELDTAVSFINQFPQVTHNYLRDHDYNLWFTLTAQPTELNWLISSLTKYILLLGGKFISLPSVRTFKIKMDYLAYKEVGNRKSPVNTGSDLAQGLTLSPTDIQAIQAIQKNLPITSNPFEKLANNAKVPENLLLRKINNWKSKQIIRRYGALFNHRKMGFTANAMSVWEIPKGKIARAAAVMSSYKNISHCYQRKTNPCWPYNLFAVIHCKTREECELTAGQISDKIGIKQYELLYSLQEYKKETMQYFPEKQLAA